MFVVHVPLIVVTNDNVLNSSVFMATAWLFLVHCALNTVWKVSLPYLPHSTRFDILSTNRPCTSQHHKGNTNSPGLAVLLYFLGIAYLIK